MPSIILVCPKCGKKLYTEDEGRYYTNYHGCTITCDHCKLNLIGVDLSVCAKCDPEKKKRINCGIKYCAVVEKI
jgi:hypothetical protein